MIGIQGSAQSTPACIRSRISRSDGISCPAFPFLKWGDFMDPAVSSGAFHLNLKKR
ncbi:hypothetical protein [Paenibacillus polymyxa]|uniref:hypothetical protein n=1 Tax=Paenibacillus polymyxa TaxID=1406 RepID=UPI001E30DCF6|nr:hypothetical protein [Paenibacillus polymyxa]